MTTISENSVIQAGIVSLAMYDFAELESATNDWWKGLARSFKRAGFNEFPSTPDRRLNVYAAWLNPELLLAQTCGYPLVTSLAGRVRLVATPTYSAEGCHGAYYSSPVIVRQEETTDLPRFRGRIFAFNDSCSQSGYNAIRLKLAPLANGKPFFSSALQTGGHRLSLEAVVARRADITSVDCVTWALLQRYCPTITQHLKVIDWTDKAPGLPLITRGSASNEMIQRLRDALYRALEDPGLTTAREALLISGAQTLALSQYQAITEMADTARSLNYPEIR